MRFVLDILNGVPTIITGIFVFGLLVEGSKQSGFAAAVALAIIMLPIVARTAQEVLTLVPGTLKEAAHALGVARWRATAWITIPTAAGGLITGALLAVARVAGETAPLILLSSIYGQGVLTEPGEALASIPIFIFQSSESPSPEAHTQAWAAASSAASAVSAAYPFPVVGGHRVEDLHLLAAVHAGPLEAGARHRAPALPLREHPRSEAVALPE